MNIKDLKKLNHTEALKEAISLILDNPLVISEIRKEISNGFAKLCIDTIERKLDRSKEVYHEL